MHVLSCTHSTRCFSIQISNSPSPMLSATTKSLCGHQPPPTMTPTTTTTTISHHQVPVWTWPTQLLQSPSTSWQFHVLHVAPVCIILFVCSHLVGAAAAADDDDMHINKYMMLICTHKVNTYCPSAPTISPTSIHTHARAPTLPYVLRAPHNGGPHSPVATQSHSPAATPTPHLCDV